MFAPKLEKRAGPPNWDRNKLDLRDTEVSREVFFSSSVPAPKPSYYTPIFVVSRQEQGGRKSFNYLFINVSMYKEGNRR